MWTYVETARIEQSFGQWYALVTLSRSAVPESFFIRFEAEPAAEAVAAAGADLALKMNLADAPLAQVSTSISREAFFSRFTNAEIAKIYRVAEVNDDLFAYVKKLEMNPSVNLTNPDVIGGLALLEQNALIAVGRAAEILGA